MAEIAVTLSAGDIDRIADAIARRIGSQPATAGSGDAPAGPKVLWREDEAAAALGISHPHLKRLRLRGYIKASTTDRPILYTREQIDTAARFLTQTQ